MQKENKLNIYTVTDEYIDYLKNVEKVAGRGSRVAFNKKELRPYIGTVVKNNDVNYFVPLASPKDKHKHMKNTLDFLKIRGGELGCINMNLMIPVPSSELKYLCFDDVENEKYKYLLKKQYKAIKKMTNDIFEKSTKLYELMHNVKKLNSYEKKVLARCCNLPILENACMKWQTKNEPKINKVVDANTQNHIKEKLSQHNSMERDL